MGSGVLEAMTHSPFALLALILVLTPAPSEARQPSQPGRPLPPSGPQRSQPETTPQTPPPALMVHETSDARQTRQRLGELFNQYPPSVREVLRIDPTLLHRPDYLATYPLLAVFLEQHPEVAHNPGYFLGDWRSREDDTPASEGFRTLARMGEQLMFVLMMVTMVTGVIWLFRAVIEHRRWQRAMRVQTDVNNKLIDRFSSSDELIAYLQSPAGKALTEPAALPQASPRQAPMNAPLSRIFWSLQSGIVVGALGIGLMIVAGNVANADIHQSLRGAGVVLLLIGVGFAVSAGVSFALSQRLGLIRPMPAHQNGEAPGL